jgi:fused signal recognition particle receptor
MAETQKRGLFRSLSARFAGSTSGLRGELAGLAAYGPIDEGFWEALEETLLSADIGPEVGLRLAQDLRVETGRVRLRTGKDAVDALRGLLVARMDWRPRELNLTARPSVILIVGVNGTGKTTTAAKLAARVARSGETVVLGAADTFRAGAIEQLRHWSERVGSDFVSGERGADPAAVAFNAVTAGLARGAGAVVIDSAGRLHTQSNLMQELAKVERSVGKAMEGAPHETLLVIDAAIGQNSIAQARVFHQGIRLTGLVLAKIDGSAKGGVVFGVEEQLGVPVKLVGTGEQLSDLEDFEPRAYVDALFEPAA